MSREKGVGDVEENRAGDEELQGGGQDEECVCVISYLYPATCSLKGYGWGNLKPG